MVDRQGSVDYSSHVFDLVKSSLFDRWLAHLRDRRAKARIEARIRRMSLGNPGDIRGLGGSLFEMRIDFGPGYRVYYTQRGTRVILLLCGGDKSTQAKDIVLAKRLVKELKE